MNWIAENWHWLAGLTGSGGLGVGVGRAFGRWLDHLATKRKQTDDMALATVKEYGGRIAALEGANEQLRVEARLEREQCNSQLAVLRHELRNELTFSDALVLAIRNAPEKAASIIDQALAMRAARRADEAAVPEAA